MLVTDSSCARLHMMPVELGCSGQVVDVSSTSVLAVNSGGASGSTSGGDLGGAASANDLSGVLHRESIQVAMVFPGSLQCELIRTAL